jgi:PTH1 family peptidyl-tRNA hydrolase
MKLSFRLFRPSQPAGPLEWLIVGLGNPGRQFENNRHNVGFQVLDRLAVAHHLEFDQHRHRASLARGRIEGVDVALLKPQTFMNLSGEAVSATVRFYKVPLERLLVVTDDLDLPVGTLRLRKEGGAGGHRGMTNIIDRLGSRAFPRLRIGIGRPPGRMEPEAYVLQAFTADERAVMEDAYRRAVRAVETVVRDGFEKGMNEFN